MVKVRIGGEECDFALPQRFSLSFDASDLVNFERGRSSQKLEIRLPLSERNLAIMGSATEMDVVSKFNSTYHKVEIVVDEVVLVEGTAYLMEVVRCGEEHYFVVECRWGVVEWVLRAGQTSLKSLPIDFEISLSEERIKAGWLSDSAVKFFPIARDSYEIEGSESDVTGVRKIVSLNDYHPFLRLRDMVEALFGGLGYSVESSLIGGELFDELYMSGNYGGAESGAAYEAMSFFVKRTSDGCTTADSMGRVFFSPNSHYNSVGDFATLSSTASDMECYNRGNVLQRENGALVFRPLTNISVGFEYRVKYIADYLIENRLSLRGIDSLREVGGATAKWNIDNRNVDQRGSVVRGVDYKLMIFGFEQGERYRLVGYSDSDWQRVVIASCDERMSTVCFDELYDSYVLEVELFDGEYTRYDGDWAIYFGYVEEQCRVEVDATVRMAPQNFSPRNPMLFEDLEMGGGIAGGYFELLEGSSIKPYFAAYPGYGSMINFEDVAMHSMQMSELLGALQHLFNLRFYGDEAARKIYIEPFESFYTSNTYDWSEKILGESEVVSSDWAHTAHRSNKLGYQQCDGVVKREGESDNRYFGEWSFGVDSYAASPTARTQLNPIFSASTNNDKGVLLVGDRDDMTQVNTLNFAPRVVKWLGYKCVNHVDLPYVAFHSPDDGFSLCFEDRDSVVGLHRFYDREVELLGRSSLLRVRVRMTAWEYANLLSPTEGAPSIRDQFCFVVRGELHRGVIESITDYDVESGVAEISFLKI